MARTLNRLGNVKQVEKLLREAVAEAAVSADGGGLYLRRRPDAQPTWIFISTRGGKRIEIKIGEARDMALADARTIAGAMREAIGAGRDPRQALPTEASRDDSKPVTQTFGAFAEKYITDVEQGWRNPVHRQQWRNSLRDHAKALNDLPIDAITTENVLTVLRPIWLEKAETARRVRGRIETILNAAKASGLRPIDSINPAAWKGHLALLLPKQSKTDREHHAALTYAEAPTFWKALARRPAASARCLEFTILTAARSGETLGATWAEINLDTKTWTVPAGRMKAGVEHVVPLSRAALAILERVKPDRPEPLGLVFAVGGVSRSNMAMAMLLRRMGYGHITTHGFRSTFRDWAGDATDFPRELAEMALAHTIGNKAEAAYRRGRAIEKRRALMDAWSEYLAGGADITPTGVSPHPSIFVHPGDFLKTEIIEANGLDVATAAERLGVTPQTLSRLLNQQESLSAEMAVRVEKAFGVQADTMLRMQAQYDLAQVRLANEPA